MRRRPLAFLIALPALLFASEAVWAQAYTCSTSGGTNCRALIPDQGSVPSPVPLDSVITVVPTGDCVGLPLTGVSAQVHVLHDWQDEVGVELISPASTVATLKVGVVGSYPNEDFDQLFPAATLLGESAAGAWTLRLTDVDRSGYGALDDWTLNLSCAVAPPVPTVTIVASDPIATEVPITTGELTVTRSEITTSPLVVALTIGGSATNGADYTPILASVTIPANQASATILVTPIADGLAEPAETVIVSIASGGDSYVIGAENSATVTITSAEVVPEIPSLSPTGLLLLVALFGLAGAYRLRRRRA